jgi:hypothetical protein
MYANDSPRVNPLSRTDIEQRTKSLLTDFFRDEGYEEWPLNVDRFLSFLDFRGDLKLVIDQLPASKEGEYTPETNVLVLPEDTYNKACAGEPRYRFTIVHEIGHAILHGHQLRVRSSAGITVNRYRRQDLRPFEDPEWQANAFAAGSLLPIDRVVHSIRPFIRNGRVVNEDAAIDLLRGAFGVSKPTASRRLIDLAKLNVLK